MTSTLSSLLFSPDMPHHPLRALKIPFCFDFALTQISPKLANKFGGTVTDHDGVLKVCIYTINIHKFNASEDAIKGNYFFFYQNTLGVHRLMLFKLNWRMKNMLLYSKACSKHSSLHSTENFEWFHTDSHYHETMMDA